MKTERAHHNYSPSQLQSLEACPSYEGAQSFSEAAERGTKLHTVAETGEDDSSLSDEDVADASAAMQFAEQQKVLLGDGVLDLRETYLPIDDADTTAGTADRIFISADRKRAILIDYKYGKHAVEPAANNRQSDAYAVSVFHAYPTVELVQVFFFQPAVKGENTVVWDRKDVPELILRIKVIVARAKAAREAGDFSTAAPHTPVCNFCRHLAVCPAIAKHILSVARKFSPLEVDALDLTPTRVHSPEEAAAGMRLKSLVLAWANAYGQLILDRCLRGGLPPSGYRLASRATREIVDSATFRKIAEEYLTPEEIETTVEIGMTKIEKLIAQKAPRGMKTATIDAFQAETERTGAIEKKAPYAYLTAKTEDE